MLGRSLGWRFSAALLTAAALAVPLAAGQPLAYAEEPTFTISGALVREPTGMARDTAMRGGSDPVYWLVERRGPGRVVAVDNRGQSVGETRFGVRTTDVQALAKTENRLYVADIGDESATREQITVYRMTNPRPGNSQRYRAYDFRYPDGAKDARAMFIRGGRIHFVTQGDRPGIYQAPKEPRRDAVNELARIGDAPPNVTDAVSLSDGRIALRSYNAVIVMDRSGGVISEGPVPAQQAGESMARGEGSKVLLGDGATVLSVGLPQGMTQNPDPPTQPSQSKPPAPGTGGPDAGSENAGRTGGDIGQNNGPRIGTLSSAMPRGQGAGRGGTLMALGAAALLAIVAAVVVQRTRPSGAAAGERPRVTMVEQAPLATTPEQQWPTQQGPTQRGASRYEASQERTLPPDEALPDAGSHTPHDSFRTPQTIYPDLPQPEQNPDQPHPNRFPYV